MVTELEQIINIYESALNGIKNGHVDSNTVRLLQSVLNRLKKLKDSSQQRTVTSRSFDEL